MFEWDEAKREKNLAKHGVDFDLVWDLSWLKAWIRPDIRKDYGELRYVAYIPIDEVLYCCVYTERNDNKRIISLRKANSKEIWMYEKETLND